ncbi:hypothetical protein KAFR_0K02070 [Kazachstania africana CBS 2517]|uniref:Cyclin-like domain-containing protein n=1 Tax=Kazachstania africana (strain ATCC 22294 / BCRC 22015 / CBS 2517 / CECT 1963 / NBRC 1671 / NRRL Y-8276) TaxID=1071382 RepID=H2B1R1_KAZAF|nr:hypothetical protein KAFR_0K02070 [Kazachstania africana CBS 2517]CCF60561.1 hypothetical protein KAFR_0K02070 [Kazachstania africana CBS 2517]
MSESTPVSTANNSTTATPDPVVPDKPPNYKVISDDDLYRHSSQYRFWSFTKDNLKQKRLETNSRATQKIEEDMKKFIGSQTLTNDELNITSTKAIPLTMEEELKLVNFYTQKVKVISQHLNLPTEVTATAIVFFKKFFIENSVMEFDPKELVHTTIFLACKSENYFISVDSFARKAKSSREAILKYEFTLLESLKFSLLLHHPYKPLHGFFLDIQNVLHDKVDLNHMGRIYDACRKRITESLLTDIIYHFTPPQITLAILLIEDEQLITKYLEIKFTGDENSHNIQLDKLLAIINSCKEMILSPDVVPTQDAKVIAAKNYYVQHPMVLINKYRKKREGQESTAEPPEKRLKTD